MSKAKPETVDDPGRQSIEELQKRYQKLDKKRTEAETELKGAKKRLEDLKKEAREKYGTDDVADLQRQLQAMKMENEKKRATYQADLDRIETELAEVQKKFTEAESPQEAP